MSYSSNKSIPANKNDNTNDMQRENIMTEPPKPSKEDDLPNSSNEKDEKSKVEEDNRLDVRNVLMNKAVKEDATVAIYDFVKSLTQTHDNIKSAIGLNEQEDSLSMIKIPSDAYENTTQTLTNFVVNTVPEIFEFEVVSMSRAKESIVSIQNRLSQRILTLLQDEPVIIYFKLKDEFKDDITNIAPLQIIQYQIGSQRIYNREITAKIAVGIVIMSLRIYDKCYVIPTTSSTNITTIAIDGTECAKDYSGKILCLLDDSQLIPFWSARNFPLFPVLSEKLSKRRP